MSDPDYSIDQQEKEKEWRAERAPLGISMKPQLM